MTLTHEGFRQIFRSCLPESWNSASQSAVRIESYLVRWVAMAGADISFKETKSATMNIFRKKLFSF